MVCIFAIFAVTGNYGYGGIFSKSGISNWAKTFVRILALNASFGQVGGKVKEIFGRYAIIAIERELK